MAQDTNKPNEPLLFDDKELEVSEEEKRKQKIVDYEELRERRLAKKVNKRNKNENKGF